jgi:hypothetical protein
VTEDLSGRLLRLPLYYEVSEFEQRTVVDHVINFLRARQSRPVLVGSARAGS